VFQVFDTVRLGVAGLDTDIGMLKRRGWEQITRTRNVQGEDCDTVQLVSLRRDESPHYLSYSPESHNTWGELKVETSLPKMLYDDNVELLRDEDMPAVLDELSNRVSDAFGDIPHVGEWNVRGRFDAVFGWDAKGDGCNHVPDYLHAFKSLELPRHYSQSVDRESTLYWRNKSRVIRMYDKEAESKLDKACGTLRFEVQSNRAKSELKRSGVESLKVQDVLTWDNAKAILESYLGKLGADLVVTDEEKAFRTMVGELGYPKARRLLGTIHAHRIFSRDELENMGASRKTLWREVREINNIGLSVATSESGLLPPLTLPEKYDGSPVRLFNQN
jgi:hypothetical protein